MNDEQLSALLDDELTPDATREAVTELLAEAEARSTWGRYHLIGDALRANAEQGASVAKPLPKHDNVLPFPTQGTAPQPARKPLSRTSLGLAAAAALAAVALIVASPGPQSGGLQNGVAVTGMTPGDSGQRDAGGQVVQTAADDGTESPFGPAGISQTGVVEEDAAQRRMDIYLTNFNEQRARQRAPGAHPYVHFVGYGTQH